MENVTSHSQGYDEINIIYRKIKRIRKHIDVINHMCDDICAKFLSDWPTC